jgi:hypothetical protein
VASYLSQTCLPIFNTNFYVKDKGRLLLLAIVFFWCNELKVQDAESNPVKNLGHQSTLEIYSDRGLFSSTSEIVNLNLSKFYSVVAIPVDTREKFYHESAYGKIAVRPMFDFSSPVVTIQDKIKSDLASFGAGEAESKGRKKITIKTTVEVLYPHVRELTNSFCKVRLVINAALNDSSFINKKYESLYFSTGSERQWRGGLVIGLGANTDKMAHTLTRIALRKVLDKFYADLNRALNPERERINIIGRVINASTGEGLRAKILVNSDSAYSITSSPDGKFSLKVVRGQVFYIEINSPHFINLSEQLDTQTSELKKGRTF